MTQSRSLRHLRLRLLGCGRRGVHLAAGSPPRAERPHLAKKPNYDFEKRKREQEKKAKKEEKKQRRLDNLAAGIIEEDDLEGLGIMPRPDTTDESIPGNAQETQVE